MPRVSVVMPVFNGERYFDRAIPSILSQTYKDFELIIVNDGSTDRTSELLAEVAKADPRVVIINVNRVGFARALNIGIEQAQGDYIVRQDFDDISYPDRIRQQVHFLDSNSDYGIVGSYYLLVDSNRNERYIRKPPTEHEDLVRAMACYIPFAHTLVTFRKQAWIDVGGYPEVDNIVDLRMWLKIAKAGWRIANLDQVLGEHWVHADSYWHRNFRYARRQRELAMVQTQAIRELRLPAYLWIYPIARYVYAYLPNSLKRVARRTVVSNEADVRT